MGWRRLPTFLPSFPLILNPLTKEQRQIYEKTGFLKELTFRTIPRVNKIEIRRFLERVHGLAIESVHTLNYDGKKKRGKFGFYRRPDWKKVYVTLKENNES